MAASRRSLYLLPIAIVVALLVWALWPTPRPTVEAPVAAAPQTAAPLPSPMKEIEKEDVANLAKVGAPTLEKLEKALAHYKESAIYPPWTRPHDEGSKYLLEWNKPAASELTMDESPGSETLYKFDADRAHVAYGEAITSWIEVWKTGKKTERLPVTFHAAYVNSTSGPSTAHLLPLSYHDDGLEGDQVAGDLRYTNRFVPSASPVLKSAQQVHLLADVESSGGQRRQMMREFTYTPRKVLEVTNLGESVRNGNLVVTLKVEVLERGTYVFLANLMSGDGQTAIAYAEQRYPLEMGPSYVDLPFFGKVLVDKGLDAPYLVRDLRGFELFTNGEEMVIWWSDPRTLTTRPYPKGTFSSAEWDSPEKREHIKLMGETIDKTRSGELSGPGKHIHIGEDGVAREVP